MQGDPIKPTLKAPGSERLKLYCDELPSNLAFKFNLRRYTVLRGGAAGGGAAWVGFTAGTGETWQIVDLLGWNFTSF